MAKPTLLPDPTCLHLTLLDASEATITAVVTTTSDEAECPLCHGRSARIHSRYVRQVADLPWMGCAVRLEVHVRRFFCLNQECARQIFTERLPSVVVPYARHTTRLGDLFTLIGFALGGEAGKRLVAGMGLSASPDTLLRLIHATEDVHHSTPRVLGVDDFSFLRARKFGTILIDLEKRIPVELLPDREAETLKKWLMAHPGVEIISRDRGGAYAEGASLGAPQARQVADRFHLLVNLSETLEDFFLNKRTALKDAVHDPESLPSPLEEQRPVRLWHKGVTKKQEEKSLQLHQERVERYHKVHDLHSKKADVAAIARELGMARRTVYHYLKMEQPPERMRIMNRKDPPKKVAPYQEYLLRRWNEGCRNARKLWRELTEEQGYTASYSNVERFLAPLRTTERKFKQEEPAAQPVRKPTTKRPPSAKQVSRWVTLPQDRRLDWQNAYLERLFQADPVIARTAELMVDFAIMLREREGERLDEWLEKVETQEVTELRSFAQGLRKDYDAVKAGLTLCWSNGQVEGQVHRLKLLKRQMYGRASFETLRKRVLRRA
jgi:transposase